MLRVQHNIAEYDVIVSKAKLAGMGFQGVKVLGPVLERETGTPEFARGAFEFHESLIKSGDVRRHDLREPKSINEIKAAEMLERFDKLFVGQLMRESKAMQEAEAASDLSLPYSVSRAILQAVWPELIATSIFDTGVTDQAPSRVYYETYAGEAGSYATITDEHVTTVANTWVAMAHAVVRPGGLVIQDVRRFGHVFRGDGLRGGLPDGATEGAERRDDCEPEQRHGPCELRLRRDPPG